jgi:hypothetical protein
MSFLTDMATKAIDVAGKFIPDADKKMAMQAEVLRMAHEAEQAALKADTDLALGQIEVNKVEAGSTNLFVSGWRPAVGWVCVCGLSYSFVLQPIFSAFSLKYLGAPLDGVDIGELMVLLLGMLGLGGMRTFEKVKGVSK